MLLNDFERDFRVWVRGSWRCRDSLGVQSRTTRPRSCTAFCRSSSSDETLRCFMWSSSESDDCDDQPFGLAWTWNKFFLPFIVLYFCYFLSFLISFWCVLIGPINSGMAIGSEFNRRVICDIYKVFDSLISVWLEINEFRTCWCYYSAFSFDGISLSGLFFEIFKQFRILANFLDVPHTNFDLFQGVFSPTSNPRNYDDFVLFDEFVCRGFSLVFSSVFYKSLF